ncbi:MAG TPA: hypothetical protein VLA72_05170 [Anaerolineales bacterium]|nr:hypothetical protein [Anaerolineales bacterium]
MYEWTEPYEDEYIRERIEELRAAQQDAVCHGRILPDLQSLFADDVVVSNLPKGCPIASSATLPIPERPVVISWADYMTQKGIANRNVSRQRARQVTQNQAPLS